MYAHRFWSFEFWFWQFGCFIGLKGEIPNQGSGNAVKEGVRLLKLFYYSVVEHVRSTDGFEAWHLREAGFEASQVFKF